MSTDLAKKFTTGTSQLLYSTHSMAHSEIRMRNTTKVQSPKKMDPSMPHVLDGG